MEKGKDGNGVIASLHLDLALKHEIEEIAVIAHSLPFRLDSLSDLIPNIVLP